MSENDLPDDLMRPGEAAKLLGIHVGTLYRWFDAGKLTYYRIDGHERRVSRRDLLAMVQVGVARKAPTGRSSAQEKNEASQRTLDTLKRHGLDRYL